MLIGDYLVENSIVTDEMRNIALLEQEITRERLGEILVRRGFITRSKLRDALEATGSRNLSDENFGADIETVIPAEYLQKTRTIVKSVSAEGINIATLHPVPSQIISHLEKITGQKIFLKEAAAGEIYAGLNQSASIGVNNVSALIVEEDINRIFESITSMALREGASDIHIIPSEKTLDIQFKRDGMLYTRAILPLTKHEPLMATVKFRAGMDTAEKRVSQDNSFSIEYQGRTIDLRVGTMMLINGEKATIRVLDKEKNLLGLRDIGITESMVDEIADTLNQSSGIILVTGGTGNGKTTTLNSLILGLDRLHRTVNTIEDPVEYRINGIQQSQVNLKLQPPFDFASWTRTILRHAPQVIVVGEIRDPETAVNTFNAAYTGHLVLATMHTDNAKTTIPRLAGLGVDKSLLPLVTKAIISQRLVRKLCVACNGSTRMGEGKCPVCEGIGYKDQVPIIEFVRFRKPGDFEAFNRGDLSYYTFADDARAKVISGITDCSEIERVTDGEFRLCQNGGECIAPGRSTCHNRSVGNA